MVQRPSFLLACVSMRADAEDHLAGDAPLEEVTCQRTGAIPVRLDVDVCRQHARCDQRAERTQVGCRALRVGQLIEEEQRAQRCLAVQAVLAVGHGPRTIAGRVQRAP